jgi:hypothetical protein
MISLLAYSALLYSQGRTLPIEYIPKAQFAFDRNVAVMESGVGQPPAVVLVNDENVSNEILDAVSKHQDFVRIVELVRMDVSGSIRVWDQMGNLIRKANALEIPKNIVTMEPGQVYIVLETPFAGSIPKGPKDAPTIQCNVAGARGGRAFAVNNHFYNIQKIGVSMFKFANLRFSVQVRSFVDTLGVTPGSTNTAGGVVFTVNGLMADRGDKLEHFEVVQSGFVGMENFALIGLFDWDRVEKEVGPVKNRNEVLTGKPIKNGTDPVDVKDTHLDFASKRQVTFLSSFAIVRSSAMQGYFQHIPIELASN